MSENKESMDQLRHPSSSSYLVRVWQEPGQDADVRFYLRDLKTGEERYLGDAERIGEMLTRGLREKPATRRRIDTA